MIIKSSTQSDTPFQSMSDLIRQWQFNAVGRKIGVASSIRIDQVMGPLAAKITISSKRCEIGAALTGTQKATKSSRPPGSPKPRPPKQTPTPACLYHPATPAHIMQQKNSTKYGRSHSQNEGKVLINHVGPSNKNGHKL